MRVEIESNHTVGGLNEKVMFYVWSRTVTERVSGTHPGSQENQDRNVR